MFDDIVKGTIGVVAAVGVWIPALQGIDIIARCVASVGGAIVVVITIYAGILNVRRMRREERKAQFEEADRERRARDQRNLF